MTPDDHAAFIAIQKHHTNQGGGGAEGLKLVIATLSQSHFSGTAKRKGKKNKQMNKKKLNEKKKNSAKCKILEG